MPLAELPAIEDLPVTHALAAWKSWLAGRGFGMVPVADPRSLQWAGWWIAVVDHSEGPHADGPQRSHRWSKPPCSWWPAPVPSPAEVWRATATPTRGIDVNALVGRHFTVGDVRCRGLRLAEPFAHLERLQGPGLLRPLIHRGGLRVDILVDGNITPGSPITAARDPSPSR